MQGYEQDKELGPLLFGEGGGGEVIASCRKGLCHRCFGETCRLFLRSLGKNLGYMGRWALRPREGVTEMRMLLHYEPIASLPY
jgi:hypothetical protein